MTLDYNDAILLLSSYAFDASIEQIIIAFFNGAKLVMLEDQIWKDADNFYRFLNDQGVTHLESTPTFFEQYDFKKIISLKRVILGGEKITSSIYKKIKEIKTQAYNIYGSTEATISSLISPIQLNPTIIGLPIENIKVYILNYDLSTLPIGAIGELYIGGAGLARGYLNNEQLTAERFIPNPFQTEAEKGLGLNSRIYKTGDLVRWLPDGNVEYIGRNDSQVKIRGYRIELGEIESVLSGYDQIKESTVIVKQNDQGNKFLIGYYVSENILDESEIISYLSARLPEYMIPIRLVHMEKFPLTVNGKLDKQAFHTPNLTDTDKYIAPRNEIEVKLSEIWSEILAIDQSMLGIRDNFFRLGGNSILAITLASKINQFFDADLKISQIFIHCNIEMQATKLFQSNKKYQPIIKFNYSQNKPNLLSLNLVLNLRLQANKTSVLVL